VHSPAAPVEITAIRSIEPASESFKTPAKSLRASLSPLLLLVVIAGWRFDARVTSTTGDNEKAVGCPPPFFFALLLSARKGV